MVAVLNFLNLLDNFLLISLIFKLGFPSSVVMGATRWWREREFAQELEQRLREAKLRQLQSEEDSWWLHQEESNLVITLRLRPSSILFLHHSEH